MSFKYKKVDKEGLDILNTMSLANKLNQWMYQTILPFCSGKILEVGSGLGNISQYFIREKKDIYLSDIRSNYRERLANRFCLSNDKILDIDIVQPDFNNRNKALLGQFDSIFCLNVVEHIENDKLAVENMFNLLKKGGYLIILVPAYQNLYNNFDKTLEHYRRYNKKTLTNIMKGKPIKTFYFNSIGIIGWYVSGKILKNKTLPEKEVKLYNYFVPVIKLIDKFTFNKLGLSVISISQK